MNDVEPKLHSLRLLRRLFGGGVVLIAVVLIGLIFAAAHRTPGVSPDDDVDSPNPLKNPPGMADRLDFYDSKEAFGRGKMERLTLDKKLTLNDPKAQFPRRGLWISPEVATAFPITEVVPSWNPDCPAGTGLRMDVRVRDVKTKTWSQWFYLGSWGKTLSLEKGNLRVISDAKTGARVSIDHLLLKNQADQYQVRVDFYAFTLDATVNPSLRRLVVGYSGYAPSMVNMENTGKLEWAKDLNIPFRAQGNAAKPLRPEICSPTSVSMVLQSLGYDKPTDDNALAIYDDEYDMFGNWGRAVAYAGQLGYDAWLQRFRNIEQVKAVIATGQPIVASIRFKKGEAPSFVMEKTAGHLIVIRGLTADGNYIVNDPASRDKGAKAIYNAQDMNRAWLDHGGVGYIIRKAL